MITEFDKTNLRLLRAAIDDALAPVATQFNISLKCGNASYRPERVTFKVEGALIDSNTGVAMTKERQDFVQYAPLEGIPADKLDKVFKFRNEAYVITGYKSKSWKNPILGKNTSTGKTYKFSTSMVKAAFGIKNDGKFSVADMVGVNGLEPI